MRLLVPLFSLLATGCLEAPTVSGEVVDRFLEDAPGASLASTCESGEMSITYAVSSHPLVDHYTAVVTADGTELTRLELGFDGTGSVTLDAETVAACTPNCLATLHPVDADGGLGAALFETTLGLDIDEDGVLSGFCGGADCDDGDATINPSSLEVCDGIDNNCSGIADDLTDAPAADLQDGVCAGSTKVCDGTGGWIEPDYAAYSSDYALVETCDGLDNDCSGQADDLPGAPFADKQAGVCNGAKQVCDGSGGWVEPDYAAYSSDYNAILDDCDGLDNDCDYDVDDAAAPPADKVLGVCVGATKTCDGARGWIEPDYTAHSDDYAAIDDCDGLDNDCNDVVDDTPTANIPPADKSVGVCTGQVKTCDGTAWQEPVYTGISGYEADEVSCDSFDNDCDGTADNIAGAPLADVQHGVCAGAEQICDGSGGWIEPDYALYSADYHPTLDDCDGLDNDCDNDVDDAPAPPGDLVHGVCAGAIKTCDGVNGWLEPDYFAHNGLYTAADDDCDGYDNNCDDAVDNTIGINIPDAAKQDGVCENAKKVCDGTDWQEPDYTNIAEYQAAEDRCDDLDNDCNGAVDDIPNAPDAQLQDGVCAGALKICDGQGGWVEPDYSVYSADYALTDDCDGLDNDCNSAVDDTPSQLIPPALKQDGVCAGSVQICGGGSGWVEPDYATSVAFYEPLEETCDTYDNDCDGYVDTIYDADLTTTVLECIGDSLRPIEVIDEGPWKQVYGVHNTWEYIDEGYSCAIDMDDALHCWGYNEGGALGDGTTQTRRTIAPVSGGHTWKLAALGGLATCGIRSDDTLWCWGYDVDYATPITTPTQVGTNTWKDVSLGANHRCAIASDDTLWCWGENGDGQLGLGDDTSRTTPTQVGTELYTQISASEDHTCAMRTDDTIWCSGSNWAGQLGVDPSVTRFSTSQVEVAPPSTLTWGQVSVGQTHTCALASDSNVYCWGYGAERQLGDGQAQDSFVPVLAGGGPYTSVLAAGYQTCADNAAGELWCWGSNGEDNLIPGAPYYVVNPSLIHPDLGGSMGISAWHSCALDSAGALYCWGANNPGTGPGPDRPTLVDVGDFDKVAVGYNHLCTLDDTGTAWCMGVGAVTGSTEPTAAATQVPGGPYTEIAAGNGFTCALDVDGHRWCWGTNKFNQLGQYTSRRDPSAVPLEDATESLKSLDLGYRHSCAIATDNTLTCWGEGFAYYTEKMSVSAQFKSVSAGKETTCVIDTTDALSCWGPNTHGQLGTGDTTDRTFDERTSIPGGPWRSVSAGTNFTCGTKPDDTAWCWGRSFYGQLGQGDTETHLSPIQVPGSWTDVQANTAATCGVQTDGSVWCWGTNRAHDLGADFTVTDSLTPRLVNTPPVSALHAGGYQRTCWTRYDYTEQICPL
ncbi:MAG: hypothetical protein KC912_26295 [Proteobacteria bacterium]|nr:hypothetical protein [Pseudomonadota bacterium]